MDIDAGLCLSGVPHVPRRMTIGTGDKNMLKRVKKDLEKDIKYMYINC